MEESALTRTIDKRQLLPSLENKPAISRLSKISLSPRHAALTPIQVSGKIGSDFDESRRFNSAMKEVAPQRIGAGVSVTDIVAIQDASAEQLRKSKSHNEPAERLAKNPYVPSRMRK